MLSILIILKKLWQSDREFRALLYILVALLLTGTIYYSAVEGWRIIDAIYFCIMTISTIGYGDFTPKKDVSKIFTIIFAIGGIGVFVGVVTKVARGLTQRRLEKKENSDKHR